jgi:hypothetical protein
MNSQLDLIHHRNTWMHFIGGFYGNVDKFINEAIKYRISRRVPAQIVKGMQFGDRLVLLRYANPDVFAFAEAQIIGITLDHEIAKEVGERLKANGQAEYQDAPSGGGALIERECGSYILCGSWVVKCSLAEVMAIALEISAARAETLFVMVNAELTQIYQNSVYLHPAPKFTRGVIKPMDQSTYFVSPEPTVSEPTVFAIRNYQKGARRLGHGAA